MRAVLGEGLKKVAAMFQVCGAYQVSWSNMGEFSQVSILVHFDFLVYSHYVCSDF
jgi:hypothetical protein